MQLCVCRAQACKGELGSVEVYLQHPFKLRADYRKSHLTITLVDAVPVLNRVLSF